MKDNVGTRDQISFVLNGKPIAPQPVTRQLICPLCRVDRLKQPCAGNAIACPMKGNAQ